MKLTVRIQFFARVLAPVGLLVIGSVGFAGPAVPVVVTVDAAAAPNAISPEAEGLSYESAVLRPNSAGGHYFSPGNAPLIRLFKSLGIKSLRLGGVTIDRTNLLITQTDVDELFQFAQAAEVKVIYSFRLKDGDAEAMERLARHILNDYSANLDCIAIGNEPKLINRSHGVAGEEAQVTVKLPPSFSHPNAEVCFLTAPEGDVAAKTGITVGGAEVNGDGSWHGQWTVLPASATAGQVEVTVPAASAAILKLTIESSRNL